MHNNAVYDTINIYKFTIYFLPVLRNTTQVVRRREGIILLQHVPCFLCKQCGRVYDTDEIATQPEAIVDDEKLHMQRDAFH